MKSIKDLIYFDYDKAKSLHSQLSGGLLQEITRAVENEDGTNTELGFDIKILKAKTGFNDKEKLIKTERIEVYHELLNDIEEKLESNDLMKNLNQELNNSFEEFIEKVPDYTYVKASGWCTFEDYEKLKIVLENFNEIQRLIFGSALQENPEVANLQKQIDEKLKSLKRAHNQKEINNLKIIQKKFDQLIEEKSGASLLDETLVERLQLFLATLNPNRLNFRLIPFDDFPEFQLVANLKNQFLVNGTFENVIYTYGSRPNIKLTIFGIITNCPQKHDLRTDPSSEFLYTDEDELTVEKKYDKVFRGVFSAMEGLEKFFDVYHPKVSVSPIGIYREIIMNK
ncbi:DUF6414 family protein [Chryseobacterium lacus]|uniref:DUF6414 family protein n=1 Tax=Chryseobacterium lacus TaxID=2058346 RepID=UPI000F88EA0B|nr:hypothetical protein [Chryseobacterium lacus]RST28058.1 hypothetical protein EIZ46_02245 [Chryseobacterium lacus]